ncbi:sulfatase [Candidatus Pacearchaeota archaeon]|nr:sulfatase [Candidatus Pacearchaeota archaeon]
MKKSVKIYLIGLFLVILIAIFLINYIYQSNIINLTNINARVIDDPDTRPNIVVLMVDDFDYYSWKELVKSNKFPNIKRELNRGLEFENSFVVYSLCCPSRAAFLSGQYCHNNGVYGNSFIKNINGTERLYSGLALWLTEDNQTKEEYNVLPVWLKDQGYETVHIGKYLNGYGLDVPASYVPPGWSDWNGLIDPSTYQVYNYTINHNGAVIKYGNNPEDYQTDILANISVNSINKYSKIKNPFFIQITPIASHVTMNFETIAEFAKYFLTHPAELKEFLSSFENSSVLFNDYRLAFLARITPAPRHKKYIDGNIFNGELPHLIKKPSFNESDISDKPPIFQQLLPLTSDHAKSADEMYRYGLASIMAVDDLLGKVVYTLKKNNEYENTVIIFTSDNGYYFGEHRLTAKKIPYEEGLRVPLFISGPGVIKGKTSAPVMNIDLTATIVELASVQANRTLDGRSLVPLLNNLTATWNRKQFLAEGYNEVPKSDGVFVIPEFQTLRILNGTDDKTYIHWPNQNPDLNSTEIIPFDEFYDNKKDPYQLNNAAFNLSPEQLAQYKNITSRLHSCKGEKCKMLEDGQYT